MYRARIGGWDLAFETAPGLFSPGGLDKGTAAMLELASLEAEDKVLDLGCGYGPVGIYASQIVDPAQVWMLDIDPLAIEYARRNLTLNDVDGPHLVLSDGLANLRETGFTKVFCNPPYHVDFAVPKRMIEKSFNRLNIGGALWMVTKRDAWYRNKLQSIFGGVKVTNIGDYFVFNAVKTGLSYARR